MMQEFLTYNARVAVCIAAFYLFYKLLLSRETFHRLNRAVIVGVILLSFVLPVWRVTRYRYVIVEPMQMPELTVTDVAAAAQRAVDWWTVGGVLFAAGAAAVLVRMLMAVRTVVGIIREGRHERLDRQSVLVRLERDVAPFSWIRWIVAGERDLALNGDVIIAHERAHIRLRHSCDLIVTDLLSLLQWFNPAMWLLRGELRAVHEYEADAAVLAGGADARAYQMLLIEKAAGGRWCSVANSLNHSKLKNRITMMLRKKSSRWATARVLFVVPLVCLAAAAFARTEIVAVTPVVGDEVTENFSIGEISPDNPQAKAAKAADGSDAYLMCEVMPTFNGGSLNDFRAWVMSNIRYPQQAQEQGIRGAVVAAFVVGTDGRVEDEVAILRSPDESLSAEVRRVIAKSPAWTPGTQEGKAVRVRFTMPVQFSLTEVEESEPSEPSEISEPDVKGSVEKITVVGYGAPKVKTGDVIICTGNLVYTNAKAALWIVDGREVTEEEAKALDADNIRDLTVYKDGAAVERYGYKGRDGVIVIRSKSAAGDNTESMHSIVTSGDKPVDYYIDGKKVSKKELAALPSERIANMNIDKFDDHTRIDITTKKNQ